jgi:hypothetical protein
MEAARSFETPVNFYEASRLRTPQTVIIFIITALRTLHLTYGARPYAVFSRLQPLPPSASCLYGDNRPMHSKASRFPDICLQTSGRTPWTGIGPSQSFYLHRTTHKQKNADILVYIYASCGIRTHDRSFRAVGGSEATVMYFLHLNPKHSPQHSVLKVRVLPLMRENKQLHLNWCYVVTATFYVS